MMICPHCTAKVMFLTMPEGFATERWSGQVKEEPYVRCPKCTATFPAYAVRDWNAKH
jgi:DNA-directed RNA polymerase subunit RPC12/RpoP